MISLFNQLAAEGCAILFRCFRCKLNWHVIVVGNWATGPVIAWLLAHWLFS